MIAYRLHFERGNLEAAEAVFATAVTRRDQRFKEVPEAVAVTLKFPQERIASFTCSFGAADRCAYEIVGTQGSIGSITLDPAYEYAQGVEYVLRLGKRKRQKRCERSDQFAPELLYFSDCILRDTGPEPSGEEGIADIRVIEALSRSIETGRWVSPDLPQRRRRTDS